MTVIYDAFFCLSDDRKSIVRMFDELKVEIGEEALADISQDDLLILIQNNWTLDKNEAKKG